MAAALTRSRPPGVKRRAMPDCVSCGRQIPPGKLFCDECYMRMKGRMGPKQRRDPSRKSEAHATSRQAPTATRADVTEPPRNVVALEGDQAAQGGGARAGLTPASQKKVVSMRPRAEKSAKDKTKSAKKFTITITFSEKTYERLARARARLKRGEGKKAKETAMEAVPAGTPAAPRKRKGRRGPYGRPLLRAVESSGKHQPEARKGLKRVLLHRRRAWDRGDYLSAVAATSGTAMILAFSFLAWVKQSWVSQGGSSLLTGGVKGAELGAPVYVVMALAALAWSYMVATALLGGERLKLDFGVVLLLAGLVIIPLIFVALSDNKVVYDAAIRILGGKGTPIPIEAIGYERNTSWPAYLMVLSGLALSLSGLARLSERRAVAVSWEKPDGDGGAS